MAATATSRRSIDLITSFTEDVINGRDLDRVDEFLSEDYVQHGPLSGVELRGIEAATENFRMVQNGVSDLEFTTDLTFSDDDGEYVGAYLTITGTHDGEFMGIPATDETIEINSVGLYRIEDGKVAEAWVMPDMLSMLTQVGEVDGIEWPTA